MTSIRAARPLVESAVLAPVYRDADGALRLVLVLRGPHGIHGGQIGLPGGRRELQDRDLRETALREAEEEIGLPRSSVEVVAELPVVQTATTGFHIAPYLGRLAGLPPTWRRQEAEIAAVLDVALADLARPEAHGEELWHMPQWPAPRLEPFYRLAPDLKLWGATYRIVHPLIPRLLAGEWPL